MSNKYLIIEEEIEKLIGKHVECKKQAKPYRIWKEWVDKNEEEKNEERKIEARINRSRHKGHKHNQY